MDKDNAWQGFLRQRRNLIVVSLVLLLVHSEELTFVKLSLFGNVTELKSQATILVILWVGWGYWALRYYQYFKDLRETTINKRFKLKLKELSLKVAKKQAYKDKGWEALGTKGIPLKCKLAHDSVGHQYDPISHITSFYTKFIIIIQVPNPLKKGEYDVVK